MTYEEFINLANNIHNHKYSYPKQKFKNLYTKIKIMCPKHGMFEQRPNTHLKGHGCKKCATEKGILLLEIKYTDNIEEKLKEVVSEED